MPQQFFALVAAAVFVLPSVLYAQSSERARGWAIAASLGAGVANVPTSSTPVYFDAEQVTARLAIQHTLGSGFDGGVSLMTTLATEGSDCSLGPCAPQFRYNAAKAVLSYIRGSAVQRWIPIASLSAGVARVPELWASAPGTRTPAATTLLLSGAVDLPLIVRPRTAVLVGWEYSTLPNAPGDRITINTIVLTVRHSPFRRTAR